jgi:hypothetical protein
VHDGRVHRKLFEVSKRLLQPPLCRGRRRRDAATAFDQVGACCDRLGARIDSNAGERVTERMAFVVGEQQGQRCDPLPQIRAVRTAELARISGEVEDVVGDLEGDSESTCEATDGG